jgi:hypothetical protein
MGPDTNHDLEGTADSYANLKSFALIEVDYADFYLTRYKRYIQSLRELTRRFPTLSGITTVRLNVEENQLVNVLGEFGICLGDLKSA